MFDSVFTECNRCGGNGKIDVYKHISNGICFTCGGSGKIHKVTNKPADVLTSFQIDCINIAKKELEDLGYFTMTDVLSDIPFEQLNDIMQQHKHELENKNKDYSVSGFKDENEWLELMGIAE